MELSVVIVKKLIHSSLLTDLRVVYYSTLCVCVCSCAVNCKIYGFSYIEKKVFIVVIFIANLVQLQ